MANTSKPAVIRGLYRLFRDLQIPCFYINKSLFVAYTVGFTQRNFIQIYEKDRCCYVLLGQPNKHLIEFIFNSALP